MESFNPKLGYTKLGGSILLEHLETIVNGIKDRHPSARNFVMAVDDGYDGSSAMYINYWYDRHDV